MQSFRGTVQRSRRSGFTMVEILIVLTIAGILLAVALPRLAPARDSGGVRSAKQAVVSYLATARQAALRRGGTATVTFSGNEISVDAVDRNGLADAVAPVTNLAEAHGVTVGLTGLTTVPYNSRGLARLAGSGKVVFTRGAAKDSVCVSILGMVGQCGL